MGFEPASLRNLHSSNQIIITTRRDKSALLLEIRYGSLSIPLAYTVAHRPSAVSGSALPAKSAIVRASFKIRW
jgi:hypothetical protein